MTAQKSGTQSLSPSFSIFTPLSLFFFFFSCCRFQTYWKSTGKKKNTPAETEKLKSQKSLCPPAGVTKLNWTIFTAAVSRRGLLVLLHRMKHCPVGDGRALPAALPGTLEVFLLPSSRAGPCLVCPRWECLQLEQG